MSEATNQNDQTITLTPGQIRHIIVNTMGWEEVDVQGFMEAVQKAMSGRHVPDCLMKLWSESKTKGDLKELTAVETAIAAWKEASFVFPAHD